MIKSARKVFRLCSLVERSGIWQPYTAAELGLGLPGAGLIVKDGLIFEYRGVTPQMDPPVLSAYGLDGQLVVSATAYRFAWEALHP